MHMSFEWDPCTSIHSLSAIDMPGRNVDFLSSTVALRKTFGVELAYIMAVFDVHGNLESTLPWPTHCLSTQNPPESGTNLSVSPKNPRNLSKTKLQVQDFRQIDDHFRGIYRIYLKLIKRDWKLRTCNRLDLETLGSRPIVPKISPDT